MRERIGTKYTTQDAFETQKSSVSDARTLARLGKRQQLMVYTPLRCVVIFTSRADLLAAKFRSYFSNSFLIVIAHFMGSNRSVGGFPTITPLLSTDASTI